MPPHSSEQAALPPHSALHPPFGHLIVHVLLPVQSSVEPVSSVTVHVLPPPQSTVLFVPVESVHVLVPVQLDVQFEPQLPSQTDCPAQLLVHPVPHARSHVFFDWQLNVALSGGAVPVDPSVPPSAPAVVLAAVPPNAQVPPALQVHVAPLQSQSPVQLGPGMLAFSLLPQPALTPAPTPTNASETRTQEKVMRLDMSVPRPGW